MDIRKALIHWLGGVTQEESEDLCGEAYQKGLDFCSDAWKKGEISTCEFFVNRMRELNGTPADEWARNVWLHANRLLAVATKDEELLEKVEKGEI